MTRVKQMIVIGLSVWLTFFFVGTGFAMDKGNKRKGKYTYRKLYKACHERGGIESAKPPVNPDAKTQAQWERLFDDKDYTEFGCAEEWTAAEEEDLIDIFTYLYEHAADSPTPAKCK